MIKKYLSVLLVGILVFGTSSALVFAQTTDKTASKAEKIKAEVLKRGTSEKKRVKVKMFDGRKIKGYISQTGEDSFTLTDSKTRQPVVIAYRDAAEVSSGWSKSSKIGLIAGAAAAATLTILFFVVKYDVEH
jgi:hypothetical protein